MNEICIIPARGGSKRVPGKNKKDFFGKPIIEYSIELAKRLEMDTWITTDDNDIAEIGIKHGCNVHHRKQYTDDVSGLFDVTKEVIESEKLKVKNVLLLYPCAPFVKKEWVGEAREMIEKFYYQCAFPVIKASESDNLLKADGYIFDLGAGSKKRYKHAAQFFYFNWRYVKEYGLIICDRNAAIDITEYEAQDINTEEDWVMAEIKYRYLKELV